MPVPPIPSTDTTEASGDATAAINLLLMGAMQWLQEASSIAPASISWHSMPRKQPPSAALGAPPAAEDSEVSFRPKRTDTVTSVPVVIFAPMILIVMQIPLQSFIPTGAFNSAQTTPWTFQPSLPKTPQMMSLPFIAWPQSPAKSRPIGFPDKLL